MQARGISVKLIKLNRIIPLDPRAVEEALPCRHVLFFEEGVTQGGIGEEFGFLLQQRGYKGRYALRGIDQPFVEHAPMFRSLEALGLNAQGMEQAVLAELGKEETL